mmetsp:Transcript_12142/g.32142  ORF Transcript_12142/g.32142 Transcript_12142/m.32142 type:complete len:263 (-) Transcript_12142:680-1468(-)
MPPLEPPALALSAADSSALDTLRSAVTASLSALPATDPRRRDRLVVQLMDSPEFRDNVLVKYLQDYGFRPQRAELAIEKTIAWRMSEDVTSIPLDTPALLRQKIPIYCPVGISKLGEPILFARARDLVTRHMTTADVVAVSASLLDGLFMAASPPAPAVTAIVDYAGFSVKENFSLGLAKACLEVLGYHYPRRLGMLFLYNYPAAFWLAYKAMAPMLSQYIRKRIVFLGAVKEGVPPRELTEYFEMDSIPSWLGGTSAFVVP